MAGWWRGVRRASHSGVSLRFLPPNTSKGIVSFSLHEIVFAMILSFSGVCGFLKVRHFARSGKNHDRRPMRL